MDTRQMETGRILEVNSTRSGGELLDDHVAGETILRLEDVGDFSEVGGELVIGEVVYGYISKDDDESTIELDSGLEVDVEAGDRVDIYPISIEKWALVELLSEEDAISARVPHSLYALLDDVIRDPWDQESVLVYIDNSGDWVVYDMIGQSASFDGRYIDPKTLPQQSDGEAPALSPQPVLRSGIGMLFVGWEAIPNPDLVTYDVYIGEFSGFPVDESTFSGSVSGTILVARTLPNGTAFEGDTDYWVRIVARDVDGAAPVGPESSSTVEMPVDQGQFDDLDTRLDALRTDLTTAEGNIGNLNTDLATAKDDIVAAQTAADAAQATGNLAQQTADSAATEAAEAKSIGEAAQATGDQATQDAADAWDEAAKKLARVAAGPGVKTFHNPLNWGKSVNGETGSIVVRTPITFGNYMTTISFRGYNYHTTTGREISAVVNFYAYSGGASGDPSFPQTAQTSSGEVSITFRLAKDADEKVVIILDNSEGIWHYPKLSVTEMLMGQATPPDSFADGWTAEVASDLSDLTILNTPARRDLDDTHSLTQGWRKTGTVEIDGGHIAADSVTALQILAGTIGATELAAESVIADKLAANAVTAGKIEAGAVTTTKLDALAVTAAKIAADAVVAGKIAAEAVVAGNIAADAVTASTIAANAVTAAKINANAVTANKIAANAVTANKIEAGAVIAVKIASGAVITEKLDAGAVTAQKVAANAIEAIHIKAGEIVAEHIAANAITTAELDSEAINGMTITGALFQTSSMANRGIKLDDDGLRAYDSIGTLNFFLDPNTGTGEIKAGPLSGNHVHIGHTNHAALNPGAGAVEFWSEDVLAGGIAGDLGYVNFLARSGLDIKAELWHDTEGTNVERGGSISLLNDPGYRGVRIQGGPLDGGNPASSKVEIDSMGQMYLRSYGGGDIHLTATGGRKVVIDGTGGVDIGPTNVRAVNGGNDTVPGGSVDYSIAHGLGASPKAVVASSSRTGGNNTRTVTISGWNATHFTCTVHSFDGSVATNNSPIRWIAMR